MQPIRKPLQYRKPFSTTMPSSQSTLSFNNYHSTTINSDEDNHRTEKTSPNHIPFSLSSNQHHVKIAPGLIDLSTNQHQNHILQRTFSVPNCQHSYNHHSIEALTRKVCPIFSFLFGNLYLFF